MIHTKDISKEGGSSARDVLKGDNVQAVQQNLRTLIERFDAWSAFILGGDFPIHIPNQGVDVLEPVSEFGVLLSITVAIRRTH
jgi:hypothetical protein